MAVALAPSSRPRQLIGHENTQVSEESDEDRVSSVEGRDRSAASARQRLPGLIGAGDTARLIAAREGRDQRLSEPRHTGARQLFDWNLSRACSKASSQALQAFSVPCTIVSQASEAASCISR